MRKMEFLFLADREEDTSTVAHWYFTEWGRLSASATVEFFTEQLNGYLNRDAVPLVVLAVDNGVVIGAAQLKYHEMKIYPDKEHWLGGVYVDTAYRGSRVASALVNKVEEIAISFRLTELYLQTERLTGGLYTYLGWQPVEQVNYHDTEVLVMRKALVR